MKTIDRRTFIAGGAAVAAGIVRAQSRIVNQRKVNGDPDPAYDVEPVTDAEFDEAVKLLRGTTMFDDAKRAPALAVVQRAIDRMVASRDFTAAMNDATPKATVDALLAKYPVMRWYDESFDRILGEFEATTVTGDTPAIWYLYNMGVVVKTKTCSFGIDICHRKAARLAKHLDFLLVTHNHGDHLNMRLIGAMSGAGKPVISNFHLAWDWYCRDMEKTFKYKDVTIPSSTPATATAWTTSSRRAGPTSTSGTAQSGWTSWPPRRKRCRRSSSCRSTTRSWATSTPGGAASRLRTARCRS